MSTTGLVASPQPPRSLTKLLPSSVCWYGKLLCILQNSNCVLTVVTTCTKQSKATPQDLKWVIRLMLHDLKIGAQAKNVLPVQSLLMPQSHLLNSLSLTLCDGTYCCCGWVVFQALHSHAYEAYTRQSNLANIINHYAKARKAGKTGGAASASASSSSATLARSSSIGMMVMTPVKPMLAKACKSFEECIRRCPEGFFAEIKYDGERVQIHKNGDNYQYFSRSLKPVQPYKVSNCTKKQHTCVLLTFCMPRPSPPPTQIKELEQYIPKAFPECDTAILDAELLVVDPNGVPLPFGSLGNAALHMRVCVLDSQRAPLYTLVLYRQAQAVGFRQVHHLRVRL